MKKFALFIMSLTCVLLLSSCNKMIFESNGDGTCSLKSSIGFLEKEIVIPSESPKGDTVTEISSHAFKYCKGFTSITIPDSVSSIGGGAFRGCSGLTSVTIPNSVTSIGNWAFDGCLSLTSITIPDSVTSIGRYAFSGCSGLTSVTIPDSVTSIGDGAVSGCWGLTSILVAEGNSTYKSIDGNLYSADGKTLILYAPGKTNESFSIPDSVTSIRYWAFSECVGLTSVTIPDSVLSIGGGAFSDCSTLTTVYYAGTEAEWSKISIGGDNYDLTSATRYYYSETKPTAAGNYWHYDENGNLTVW